MPSAQNQRAQLQIAKILAPTDFSPDAESALTWAVELGRAFGAEVVVLHVVDLALGALAGLPASVAAMPAYEELAGRVRDEAKEEMSRVAARYPEARRVIREGSPRSEILRVAEQEGADLIVMGTHGRTGLAHLLFGSVAEHVVRHSRLPVLTVHQREPGAEEPRTARG